MATEREHDIVLFGGTGFTGALTAEYLAANAPASTRWALAGRNMKKLEALRERLGVDVPLLKADVTDEQSMEDVAPSTRVAITTVGPHIEHGEALVKACAEHGPDYTDLTGEPEFVDRMFVKYNAKAKASGARIIHACGFDSIPHDLGTRFTVEQLPEGVPLTVRGYVRAGGAPSGGTFASALTGFSRLRQTIEAARARKPLEPRPVAAARGRSAAVPATTATSTAGCCRSRRSIRRSSCAPPARSSVMAPISLTATTSPSRTCRRRSRCRS